MAFKLNFISLFKIIYKNIESNCKNIEEDCAAGGYPMYLTRLQTYTFYVNPLGPKSDQHQFSPNNISRSSRVKVMRITNLIIKGRILWS